MNRKRASLQAELRLSRQLFSFTDGESLRLHNIMTVMLCYLFNFYEYDIYESMNKWYEVLHTFLMVDLWQTGKGCVCETSANCIHIPGPDKTGLMGWDH